MKAINLYTITRIKRSDDGFYSNYENICSKRKEPTKIKDCEFNSLLKLVEELNRFHIGLTHFDNFFFDYSIMNIGKEFDLLKINKGNIVLNIELKSEVIPENQMEKQLMRNKYYLEHLAPDIYLFTFVKSTGELFLLEDDGIVHSNMGELVNVLKRMGDCISSNIEDLFCERDYLISPLNTPRRFLSEKYFLTQQQEDIEKRVLSKMKLDKNNLLWGITGNAGTGKTLLLYDLIRKCSQNGKCCVVHCGILCDGHLYLNQHFHDVDIIAAKDLTKDSLREYKYVFVDETQRIYTGDLNVILETSKEYQKPCVFSYDYRQVLSKKEQARNIPQKLKALDNFNEYVLSDKIRINKEMSYFISSLLNLKKASKIKYRYTNIDVLFAKDSFEAKKIIAFYQYEKDFVFIGYTQSRYYRSSIDNYEGDINTHHVIGQEFSNVMIMLDNNFQYGENGDLQAYDHPNPDYIFPKLFYQAVTRVREKLCVLVVENWELFEKISMIQYRNIGC